MEDVETLRSRLAELDVPTEVLRYATADHGFHCDVRSSYNAEAATDAWAAHAGLVRRAPRLMGEASETLDDKLIEWIGRQHVFFVATAPAEGGHVNLSPKGHDSLRVLDPSTVAYLDLTGSGAETIAHTRENGRITVMFCAFEGPPQILRLFGAGRGPSARVRPLRRAVAAVPLDPRGPLDHHRRHRAGADVVRLLHPVHGLPGRAAHPPAVGRAQGDDGLRQYWADRNVASIDGLPALDPQ